MVSAGGITVSSGGGSTSIQVLSAAGAATFGSTVGITGALQATGNVNLGSSSGNTLSVASTTALQAPLTAGSTVAITGSVKASGGMTVTGELDVDFFPLTGKSHCVAKHGVQGQCGRLRRNRSQPRLTLFATVVAGTTTIGTTGSTLPLTINSPTTIAAALNAQTNATIGASSSNLLTVNGVTNFTAPVLLQSSLTATSLNLSGGLTVQGNTVLGTTSNSTLVVLAAAAVSSTLSVAGLLTASGGLAVSGTTALAGEPGTCFQMLDSYVLVVPHGSSW